MRYLNSGRRERKCWVKDYQKNKEMWYSLETRPIILILQCHLIHKKLTRKLIMGDLFDPVLMAMIPCLIRWYMIRIRVPFIVEVDILSRHSMLFPSYFLSLILYFFFLVKGIWSFHSIKLIRHPITRFRIENRS